MAAVTIYAPYTAFDGEIANVTFVAGASTTPLDSVTDAAVIAFFDERGYGIDTPPSSPWEDPNQTDEVFPVAKQTDHIVNAASASGAGSVKASVNITGGAANTDIKWEARDAGDAGNGISIEYEEQTGISTPEEIVVAFNNVKIRLGTNAGTKATAVIGSLPDGRVTVTDDVPEVSTQSIEIVVGSTPSGALSANKVGGKSTVTLGMDAGTAASKIFSGNTTTRLTLAANDIGLAGNNITLEMLDPGATPGAALSATKLANAYTVNLGTTSGVKASRIFSGDTTTRLTIEALTIGAAGNSITFEVALGVGLNQPLAASKVGSAYLVTLATDGAGAPDNAANTCALIAAALIGVAGTTITATVTVAGFFDSAQGPTVLQNGADIALDAAKNTCILIKNAINGIVGKNVTATESVAGYFDAAVASTPLAGGLDIAPDNAKNTATLVAAAFHGLAGITAVASGTGNTPFTIAVVETPLTGGVLPAPDTTATVAMGLVAANTNANGLIIGTNIAPSTGAGVLATVAVTPLTGGVDPKSVTGTEFNNLVTKFNALLAAGEKAGFLKT